MHGLDLEDAQYVTASLLISVPYIHYRRRIRRLAHDVSTGATSRQSASLTEQRNLLRARLRSWEQILPIYMPGLLQYRQDKEAELPRARAVDNEPQESESSTRKRSAQDEIEYADIWLPSKVDSTACRRVC